MITTLRILLTVAACVAGSAVADDGSRYMPAKPSPAYQQECGSCHVAYPPGLLPAPSWQRLLAGLRSHFGADASVEPAMMKELSTYLSANAGTSRRTAEEPSQDRITRLSWFLREHRKVPDATWKLAAVKSAANCTACHTQADKGDYSERNIRIPR